MWFILVVIGVEGGVGMGPDPLYWGGVSKRARRERERERVMQYDISIDQ